MTEKQLRETITQALEIYFDQELETSVSIMSFEDKGVLTNNEGLVIKMDDGIEFQLTIVRSR